MQVSEALASRRSVRAFLPRPVPLAQLKRLLTAASRAPSGGNLQPWKLYVLTGESQQGLIEKMRQAVMDNPHGEGSEYRIYPPDIKAEYEARRRKVGIDLYTVLGIGRKDTEGKIAHTMNNFRFFGAPVGLFFALDRQMDSGQWADLGMFMQSLMLLAREHGLDTCPQEIWALYPKTIGRHIGLPEHEMLFCGMSLGYADPDHPSARLETERADLDDFATFL